MQSLTRYGTYGYLSWMTTTQFENGGWVLTAKPGAEQARPHAKKAVRKGRKIGKRN